ncbi:hypothetical protein [Methylobacterium oryzihabitans]|uniref:Uncharacterized protein n=1 Tax=Methylobacterium oryzihabitans TaxID=2499852 RepID=A0A437P5D7_9HYPH|nr:hypothetical protein [Methylobacterium oryzihabitans]RVU17467.1 hypothetical protein EOE48_13855 [Methylobacterium oryzihabitans]
MSPPRPPVFLGQYRDLVIDEPSEPVLVQVALPFGEAGPLIDAATGLGQDEAPALAVLLLAVPPRYPRTEILAAAEAAVAMLEGFQAEGRLRGGGLVPRVAALAAALQRDGAGAGGER